MSFVLEAAERSVRILAAAAALFIFLASARASEPPGMARIPQGRHDPFIRSGSKDQAQKPVEVEAFYLDSLPVTNREYLNFLQAEPKWRKSRVSRLFADELYLKQWVSDLSFGEQLPNAPVVNVSWFAARAYCKQQNKKLPTLTQWEYAAKSGLGDSKKEREKLQALILQWYSRPTREKLPPVGSVYQNSFGVHDMHGLIWEWTEDFNSALVSGESREDDSLNRGLFCGSGSLVTRDKTNYPAFMRFAFRSSLSGRSTVANLGFRCMKEMTK